MASLDAQSAITSTTPASSAEQATKDFGEGSTRVRALNEITVAFESGRFSAIMGPSGSGKSTLLHCLAALEPLTTAQTQSAVEAIAVDYANAEVQDLSEYKQGQADQINQLLSLVYALLFLAIIIALIGIANTLALSILERTHELGLLRAIGMTRGQLRSSIRWESVLIALLGTALGAVIGVFFGWAIVEALRDEGFTELRFPFDQLLIVVVLAVVAGVIAATQPARRAAKMDVLEAVAAD